MKLKNFWFGLALLLFSQTVNAAKHLKKDIQDTSLTKYVKVKSFTSGKPWYDTEGKLINAHAGGIILINKTYYWFGEKRGTHRSEGVNVYSSKDLYNWKAEGLALAQSDDPASDITKGCLMERPKVIYNKKTKKYVMWFHLELNGKGYSAARAGVAISDKVTGPYIYLKSFRPNGNMSRDMNLFVDDDGSAYHIYSSDENMDLRIVKLSDDYLEATTEDVKLFRNQREAPALFKKNGKYFLITSGCTGWAPNRASLHVANSLFGPWEFKGDPMKGPGAEKTFGAQSTYVLPLGGKDGGFIFIADQWNPKNLMDSRYVFLPIQLKDDQVSIEWKADWTFPLKDSIVNIRIDLKKRAQTIENIGSSGCWFSEGIGKYWPAEKRERIAELLFSKQFNKEGQPLGIGLSSWRFNIGAGTLEQGDSSGIKDFRKRSDSFLNKDGTYDWTKQAGYRFFLQKAKDYGVETLIAFSNSPPVLFTKNGLGFKTEKDYKSNLREDAYGAYAKFLTNVLKHFEMKGLRFSYVSPVNEPQWDWSKKYMEADQEGSPWTNEEIFKITNLLNTELVNQKINSEILVTEAGMLDYLYGSTGPASRQIQRFFDPKSPNYMGDFEKVPKIIAGHSYFSESNDTVLVNTRKKLADTSKAYGLRYWQSEYSMLADGFRDGSRGQRTAMDCALFLSKVIHSDLSIGNATAWQFWNAYEPGSADFNTRYYLIALQPNADYQDGEFKVTKNLWALGHYSRFIRPGMTRVAVDILQDDTHNAINNLLVSSYVGDDGKLVVVATNYGAETVALNIDLKGAGRTYTSGIKYLTTAEQGKDMIPMKIEAKLKGISTPPRSITTIVLN